MDAIDAPPTALLDACVLVGMTRRELLFAAGRDGYARLKWSDRIEAEWRAALLRDVGDGGAAAIDGEIALARLAFPNALVENWEPLEGPLSLPDWNDRHVLAAAIAAEATILVTDNLRDFPRRALEPHGVAAIDSDRFLREWAEARPQAAREAYFALASASGAPTDAAGARATLKRARLPKLAKELERLIAA